jgi:hypothetical protein
MFVSGVLLERVVPGADVSAVNFRMPGAVPNCPIQWPCSVGTGCVRVSHDSAVWHVHGAAGGRTG